MAKAKVETVGGLSVRSNVRTMGKTVPDEPTRTFEIPLLIREVDSTIDCGFQQEWGSVEDVNGKGPLHLFAGAGWGSSWASIDFNGKSYAISATDLVAAFIDAVEGEEEEHEQVV